jgi:dTDP-4-dehydrorhamnose 3,5-epimerase-like enzyme
MQHPYLIEFPAFGSPDIGYLTAVESTRNVPFEIKRVYWSYYTPETVTRGRHAHYELQQVLVAVAGKVIISCEPPGGDAVVFVMDTPRVGLYIPALFWHVIQFSPGSVVMSLASTHYDEMDYIREYDDFQKMRILP